MQINRNGESVEIDDGVYCSIAMDEAMNTMCQGSEPAFREVAISFFGFTENDLGRLFPIEDRYRDVLDDGLADGRCTEMAEVRIFVLALAWEKVKEDAMPPKAAIQSAWADARLMCEEFGVMI